MSTTSITSLRKLARSRICPECDRRPLSLEYRSPEVERPCEPDCAIFHSVAEVERCLEASAELKAGRREVCRICGKTPASDFCTAESRSTCCLLADPFDVVEILKRLRDLA